MKDEQISKLIKQRRSKRRIWLKMKLCRLNDRFGQTLFNLNTVMPDLLGLLEHVKFCKRRIWIAIWQNREYREVSEQNIYIIGKTEELETKRVRFCLLNLPDSFQLANSAKCPEIIWQHKVWGEALVLPLSHDRRSFQLDGRIVVNCSSEYNLQLINVMSSDIFHHY